MNKQEYLKMLVQDNETEPDAAKKKLRADVIDCTEIALSQTPDTFVIDSSLGLDALWKVIEDAGNKARSNSVACVGPFEAAELIAKRLGTQYERASRKLSSRREAINIDDLF